MDVREGQQSHGSDKSTAPENAREIYWKPREQVTVELKVRQRRVCELMFYFVVCFCIHRAG